MNAHILMFSSILFIIILYSQFETKCYASMQFYRNEFEAEGCSIDNYPTFEDPRIRYLFTELDYSMFKKLSLCMEKCIKCNNIYNEINPSIIHSYSTNLLSNVSQLMRCCRKVNNYDREISYRMTIVLSDGTYYYDSNFPPPKENYNSRLSVLAAQMSRCGRGWEKKFSRTTNSTQYYMTTRCNESGGTEKRFLGSYIIRMSILTN